MEFYQISTLKWKDCKCIATVHFEFFYSSCFTYSRGYSIGCRLVDDFYARTMLPPCRSFRDCIEVLTKVACRIYFGCAAISSEWNETDSSCNITIEENPWVAFMLLSEKSTSELQHNERSLDFPVSYEDFMEQDLYKYISVSFIWTGLLRGIFEVVKFHTIICSCR